MLFLNLDCLCRAKFHELCHACGVLVAEMSIDFHSQSSAVFVREPTGDSGNIHAAFDAAGGEQVPQIVVC